MFNLSRFKMIAITAVVGAGLSGCLPGANQANINQEEMCEVDSIDFAANQAACAEGEKVLWAPNSWGNEQAPVMFAALYCDHRFTIVTTDGAVSCIYKPATKTIQGFINENSK